MTNKAKAVCFWIAGLSAILAVQCTIDGLWSLLFGAVCGGLWGFYGTTYALNRWPLQGEQQ